ncbi:hypothetical protein GCM10025876_36930 [Demequina litorisediminis]|uniref:UvrC family homology region profile domain-containing protein n=1 Tax=Demequina litorisediminis TaxID=1849022 RepID=A0ABQ6IIE6_9MICO|nr:hypothetical protein GCM10025876_36930 [Demequina litorisediminis]
MPQRGKKAELAQTGHQNAQQVLDQHRLKRASDLTTRSAALQELQEALGMVEAPLRIECYDISHTQGTHQVGSMVVFEDALPRKKEYRQFSIADAVDDTAAMDEVLTRRFTRYLEESQLPPEERESARFAYPPQPGRRRRWSSAGECRSGGAGPARDHGRVPLRPCEAAGGDLDPW